MSLVHTPGADSYPVDSAYRSRESAEMRTLDIGTEQHAEATSARDQQGFEDYQRMRQTSGRN